MRSDEYPVLPAIMVIFLITTGVMTCMILYDVERTMQITNSIRVKEYSVNFPFSQQTEGLQLSSPSFLLLSSLTGRSSDTDITIDRQASETHKSELDQNHTGQHDFNDALIYNGVISTMSVNPTMVTYDYNNDGIVDFKKTVRVVNII